MGEVRVYRVEGDFSEWGIEILVSFRDGEPMQTLSPHIQSGGVSKGTNELTTGTVPCDGNVSDESIGNG
jgi:hypothetical protein